jgi:hypothetical protein
MAAERFINKNIKNSDTDSGSDPNLDWEAKKDLADPDYEYITTWQMSDKQYFEIQKKKGGE